MEEYKPQIIENYATFLVQIYKCWTCKQLMVINEPERNSPFPLAIRFDYKTQAKAADLKIRSKVISDGHYICTECAESGKGGFTCYLCKQYKESNKLQESFGDPADYLCTDCYDTTPAKKWDRITSKLFDLHQYDWR